MSASLTTACKELLHIRSVSFKPVQREIWALRSQAAKLPGTPQRADLMDRLGEALAIVSKSGLSDGEKTNAIKIAKVLLGPIETEISALANAAGTVPDARNGTAAPAQATKADQARAQRLLEDVERVKAEIDALFTVKEGELEVSLQARAALEAGSRFTLLGRAEAIRITIGKSVMDDTAAKQAEKALGDLRETMGEVKIYTAAVRQQAKDLAPLVDQAMAVLGRLGDSLGSAAAETALAMKAKALEQAIQPALGDASGPGRLSGPAIARLATELGEELDKLGADDDDFDIDSREFSADLKAYAKDAKNAVDTARDGAAAVAMFDAYTLNNKTVFERLEELRLASDPLGGGQAESLQREVYAVRAGVAALDPNFLQPAKAAGDLLAKIDLALAAVQQTLDAARLAAANAWTVLQAELLKLDRTRTAPALTLDAKKKKTTPLYENEWKQIDAMVAAIGRMIPATANGLSRQGVADLVAAKPLIDAVRAIADRIGSTSDATQPDNLATLDARLDKLQRQIKAESASGRPLPTYYKDDYKKFTEEFDKFVKSLPTLTAADAAAGVKKYEDAMTAKMKAGREVRDYIRDVVDPAVDPFIDLYNSLDEDTTRPTLNAPGLALDALIAERSKQPPDVAKLWTLTKAVIDAFAGITTARQLDAEIDRTYPLEQQKKAKAKDDAKAAKAPLLDRLKVLEGALEIVKLEVKDANGDKNPLKEIGRLLEQAGVEIKAVKAAEAAKILDRAELLLDLVRANPAGEAARRRKDLPELYSGWLKIRATAAANLQVVKDAALSYQPDKKTGKSVRRLGRRIDAYSQMFAAGPDGVGALIGTLADDKQPDQARRDAREAALGVLAGLQQSLEAHPLSAKLAEAPFAAARAVPGRLLAALDRLYFAILTSVENA